MSDSTKPLPEPILTNHQCSIRLRAISQEILYISILQTKDHSRICRCQWVNLLIGARVTYIWVNKLTIIGTDNGLSPGRHHVIIWCNAGILLIGPLVKKFNEILIETHTFLSKKVHLKMSGKWWPFCLSLNVSSGSRWWYVSELMRMECHEDLSHITGIMHSEPLLKWLHHHKGQKFRVLIFLLRDYTSKWIVQKSHHRNLIFCGTINKTSMRLKQ